MSDHVRDPVPDLDLLSSYHFDLPEAQIAATPTQRREDARLMVLGEGARDVSAPAHAVISALPSLLRAGDLLIFNDVRVRPCRLMARKPSGGEVELLAVEARRDPKDRDTWAVAAMARSNKALKVGQPLAIGDEVEAVYQGEAKEQGLALFSVRWAGSWEALLERFGEMPLPPYIVKRRKALGLSRHSDEDLARYQTVFAGDAGEAVAAPTAGLHFSAALLDALDARGVARAALRLDVGLGTFKPVRAQRLSEHAMHSERYVITEALQGAWEAARARGGRVIAVGTTAMRALEDQMQRHDGALRPGAFETAIFLKPGHVFRAADGLITNFHLPDSTLMVLVSAFGGYRRLMGAYAEAVAAGYRFFSYGDAMLIWR
jgi:S-adenosylmethionine:tRNA ribosyltransferase-isomerase